MHLPRKRLRRSPLRPRQTPQGLWLHVFSPLWSSGIITALRLSSQRYFNARSHNALPRQSTVGGMRSRCSETIRSSPRRAVKQKLLESACRGPRMCLISRGHLQRTPYAFRTTAVMETFAGDLLFFVKDAVISARAGINSSARGPRGPGDLPLFDRSVLVHVDGGDGVLGAGLNLPVHLPLGVLRLGLEQVHPLLGFDPAGKWRGREGGKRNGIE